jgi:hypothetical protein
MPGTHKRTAMLAALFTFLLRLAVCAVSVLLPYLRRARVRLGHSKRIVSNLAAWSLDIVTAVRATGRKARARCNKGSHGMPAHCGFAAVNEGPLGSVGDTVHGLEVAAGSSHVKQQM